MTSGLCKALHIASRAPHEIRIHRALDVQLCVAEYRLVRSETTNTICNGPTPTHISPSCKMQPGLRSQRTFNEQTNKVIELGFSASVAWVSLICH